MISIYFLAQFPLFFFFIKKLRIWVLYWVQFYVATTVIALLCYCVYTADPDDPLKTTDQTRRLGLIVRLLLTYSSQTNLAEIFNYL